MPTLIDVPLPMLAAPSRSHSQSVEVPEEDEDEDENNKDETTVLYDQSMTLLLDDSMALGLTILPTADRRSSWADDGSITILHETSFRVGEESTSILSPPSSKPPPTHALASQQPREASQLPLQKAIVGPNETIYRSKYEAVVKAAIQRFHQAHPVGTLRDYRSLSRTEQLREQQRVMALLSRLHIGKERRQGQDANEETHMDQHDNHDDQSISFAMPHQDSPSDSSTANNPSRRNWSTSSPVEIARGAADDVSTPVSTDSPDADADDDADSPSSSTNPYKRPASSSAKRGADLSRIRYNNHLGMPKDGIPDSDQEDDGQWRALDLVSSNDIERLSILSPTNEGPMVPNLKDSLFPASQSPISPKLTYSSSDSEAEERSCSRRRPLQQLVPSTHDTIDTWTRSTHKSSQRQRSRQRLRDMPVHVGMKTGATFHLEKLHVQRSELVRGDRRLEETIGGVAPSRRLVDFPDPFVKYPSNHKKIFHDVWESLARSEHDSMRQTFVETTAVNVLFSMTERQIIDLCLKLFLSSSYSNRKHRGLGTGSSTTTTKLLQGETLIVARSKEELVHWERALREGTGCSVYNVAAAPLSERVRLATADKATNYDIVLTTFDGIKSADTAIPVEENGRAIVGDSKGELGWMASRGGSSQVDSRPQKCMQLSVLHKVNFRRVIFLDVLGRKSFLAKFGTARAKAATALRANSRIAFFCQTEADGDSAFQALRKSDSRAQESVTSILHLASRIGVDRTHSSHDSSSEEDEAKVAACSPLESCALDVAELLCRTVP